MSGANILNVNEIVKLKDEITQIGEKYEKLMIDLLWKIMK